MKKEIFIPFILIILGFVFIVINVFLFFSKGNNTLIKKKLKLGALILTLTSIVACHRIPPRTCYKVSVSPPDRSEDSIANRNKKDSINLADKQKHQDDSIARVNEEKRRKDSIANINPVKGDTIQPTCYLPKPPPPKTCYAPVRK